MKNKIKYTIISLLMTVISAFTVTAKPDPGLEVQANISTITSTDKPVETIRCKTNCVKITSISQEKNKVVIKWKGASAAYYKVYLFYLANADMTLRSKHYPVPFKVNGSDKITSRQFIDKGPFYKDVSVRGYRVEAYDTKGNLIGKDYAYIRKVSGTSFTRLSSTKKGAVKIAWKKRDYASGYKIEFVKGNYFNPAKKVLNYNKNTLSATIKGLSKGTYTFRVSVKTEFKTQSGWKTCYSPVATKRIKI